MNKQLTALFAASKFKVYGKCSTFGGPRDTGVTRSEGLSLAVDRDALDTTSELHPLFLDHQPAGTTGLARRLDPHQLYCACRWNFDVLPKSALRAGVMVIVNPSNGRVVCAKPADWGPNARTGRVIDLSPAAAQVLGVETDGLISAAFLDARKD